MNRTTALCRAIAIALSSILTATLAFAETRTEPPRSFPLKAGGYLSLENVNGDVTIEGWPKDEVSITAVKKGDGKVLDRIEIVIDVDKHKGKDWIDIETDYSDSTSGFLGFLKSSGSVDYAIKAPAGVILEDIELVNGNLRVSGIKGSLSLSTVNGSITATGMSGSAWAETVNGNLDLSFEKMGDGQTVDLESVNGAIVLRLPATASARVEAETLNGDIANEFGLAVEKEDWIGRSMEGLIGPGGARITLETVNGSIDIQKR